MKTIPLNCNCIISCRIPLPVLFECAVARATGAKRMLLCCHLHPREPCQPRSCPAGMGLTPSSPALGTQLLPLCTSPPAPQGQMAAAQPRSSEHPGCWSGSPRTCSTARLGLQELWVTRFVLNEERKDSSPAFRHYFLLVVSHLLVVDPSPTPSTLTEDCTMSGGLHGPCLHNFNLKTMINVYRNLPLNLWLSSRADCFPELSS